MIADFEERKKKREAEKKRKQQNGMEETSAKRKKKVTDAKSAVSAFSTRHFVFNRKKCFR